MVRPFALLAVMAMLLSGSTARAQAADPWLGRDKALHFGACLVISTGGFAGASFFTPKTWQRLAVGGGLAMAAGIGKELYDLTGRGTPSWKDLTWDGIGTAAGLGMSWAVARLFFEEAQPSPLARGLSGELRLEPVWTSAPVEPRLLRWSLVRAGRW